jgi:hypothetical protein
LYYPPQARVLSNYRNVDTKASLKIPAMTALLYGRGLRCCSGRTEKAEAAKLPDAGISLKQCPEK